MALHPEIEAPDVDNETDEDPEELRKEQQEFAKDLLDQIKEREKDFDTGSTGWWRKGKNALEIYNLETTKSEPFNILYSNTEVLLPSVYSAVPKPDIRSRFKGAKLGPIAEVAEKFLIVASDTAIPGIESFHEALSDAVLSGLVPGAGFIRLRHRQDLPFPLVYESVYHKNFIWAKGRKWAKLPWVAFKHELSKTDFASQFGIGEEEIARNVSVEPSAGQDENEENGVVVYEAWHRPSKTVWFISENWEGNLLKTTPDPFQLAGFFPIPGILTFTKKSGSLTPSPLYDYYLEQAEELNRVTVRLNKVLSAIRVRGAYSALLGDDLKNMLSDSAMENGLVEAQNGQLLTQSGGFDKAIWFLPIEKLITVAQELYKARESIKQVIYELTGISDIIRGSSVASETATAQNLKNKWGSVRLRKMQQIVAEYARDLFRLTIDAASTVIPPEKWKEVTGSPLPTAQEKAVMQQQMMYQQQMTGQPPNPQDPQMQQMMKMMQMPTIDEVVQRLASDMNRLYTINIQTSSTVDLDTATDKAEVTEFMNAMGQLLAGLTPLAQLGPSGIEAAKKIAIGVCERFKFGIPIAEAIEAIQAPPPPAGPEEDPAKQAEAAVIKAETEAKLEKIAMDREVNAQKMQLERERIEAERETLRLTVQKAQIQAAAAMQKARASAQNRPAEGASNANL